MNNELQYAFAAKNYELNIVGLLGFYYPIYGARMWITGLQQNQRCIVTIDEIENDWLLDLQRIYHPIILALTNFALNNFDFKYKQRYSTNFPEEKGKEINFSEESKIVKLIKENRQRIFKN